MTTQQGLVQELDRLRRRAAHGTQRPTVSIDRLARLTGIPRSTVHAYVSGIRLPPPDVLDVLVTGLGATGDELRRWADALERVTDHANGEDDRPTEDSFTPAPPAVPHQLPGRPTGFLGRAAELRDLDELSAAATMDPDATRVLAVTGTGGVGKTALVLTWAHRHPEVSPDGQLWIDLRGFGPGAVLDPGDALEEMLRAVGVNTAELPTSVDARAALFRTAVAGRRMLIVLDNARDAAHVRPLLPGSPGIVTVVTSRNTLRSLVVDGAARVQLTRLGRSEARSLLVADLPAELAGSTAMTRIVDRCEGLPLTLRIVRERLAGEPADVAERIAVQFERDGRTWLDEFDLPDDAGDISMRAALRWSYEALPVAAARAFRMLPLCLVPTIDVHCMAALLDTDVAAARKQLETLVAANLLERGGPDAYRTHDLVMAFAAEAMRDGLTDESVRAARVRLLLLLGSTAERGLRHTDSGRPCRIPWPDEYLDHIDSIESVADPSRWVVTNIEAVSAVVIDATRRGFTQLACVLAERAWRTLRWVADVGRMHDAIESARLSATASGMVDAAIALNRLSGVTYGLQGDLSAAERTFATGIRMAEDADQPVHAAVERQNLALVWARRGEATAAIELLTQIVQSELFLGLDRIPARLNLADLELQRGRVAAARSWLTGMLGGEASVSGALALEVELAVARCDLADARAADLVPRLAEVAHRARSTDNPELLTEALVLRSRAQLGRSDLDAALVDAQEAVRITSAQASQHGTVRALCVLADVELQRGQLDLAGPRIDHAIEIARAADLRYEEGEALLVRAGIDLASGDVAAAERTLSGVRAIGDAGAFKPLLDGAAVITYSLQGRSA